jgi:hypothetical protein
MKMTLNLRNHLLSNAFLSLFAVVVAAQCGLGTSACLAATTKSDLAAEYEEWGLEPPAGSQKPDVSVERPKPTHDRPPQDEPFTEQQHTNNPVVPAGLASRFEQAAIFVLVVFEDGKEFLTVGWIVDREQGIVLTHRHLVSEAAKLFVGYPQLPKGDKNSMTGSPAILLQTTSELDIAYLQVENPIPARLPTVTVATPSQPTQQATNPLVGQWYLQDNVNGTRLAMHVQFQANGRFQLEIYTTDWLGNEEQQSIFGTYSAQGNRLMLQGNEGPIQAAFRFEDGYLCVKVEGEDVTFMFQRG